MLAVVNSALCSGSVLSNSIISEPAKSCMIRPAVTMGPMPSSSNVPLCEANINRIVVRGSSPALVETPYKGVSAITR